jgi:plastocyanin
MRAFLRLFPIAALLAAAGGAAATEHTVYLGGGSDTFRPNDITIEVGETVTFHNYGGQHNVRANDNSFRCAVGCDGAGGSGNVPITSGFTGAWYDPNQSGHGIFIEVLPGSQMLAWWFTFNPDGTQQAWFGNVGAIDGDTATIDAIQTAGGRWIPNFDPANVTQPAWGRLVFTFTDCNHGRVDFTSSVAGYGEGHMDLTRITQPAGLSCP